MRQFILIILSFVFLFNQTVLAGQFQCEYLFESRSKITNARNYVGNKVPFLSFIKPDKIDQIKNRITITETEDSTSVTKITLKNERPVLDTNADSLELTTYLLANPDVSLDIKDIAEKGDLTLSFQIKDGYHIDVYYSPLARIGNSGAHNHFVIERFQVVAENGHTLIDIKRDKLFKTERFEYANPEINVASEYLKGLNVELDLPPYISADIFKEDSKFHDIAKYFKLYDKDELKKLIETRSIRYLLTHFKIKNQIESFSEQIIKTPGKTFAKALFSLLLSGAAIILISSTTGLQEKVHDAAVELNLVQDTTIVERVFNGIQFPTESSEVFRQFKELHTQAKRQYKDKKGIYTLPRINELTLDYSNYFSRNNKIWIIEKYDGSIKANRTYAVLLLESAKTNGVQSPEAFITEINPTRYTELINYIRAQGLVKNLDQAKVEKQKGHKHEKP